MHRSFPWERSGLRLMSTSSTSTLGTQPGPAASRDFPAHPAESEQEKLLELGARLANSYSDALTVINGHATLLIGSQDLAPAALQHVSAIFRAGEQAARMTRQLMIIGGRRPMRLETVDLHRLLDDTLPSIQGLLGAERTMELKLADGLTISADPEMLEQVLLSLAANAAEALPVGGHLDITAEVQTLSGDVSAVHPEGRAGKFVSLAFRDTGCGMTPEIRARVFEPFFTTKKIGRATSGLGLAVVRSVVRGSQGWVTVDSELNRGTTVKLFLPVAPVVDPIGRLVGEPPSIRKGKPTILLVDDELSLRELTAMILQSQGFRVLQAGNGAEALEVWKWHSARIDLLFTDLVMPGNLSGLDLAEIFQKEKSSLKIVCMTGNLDQLPGQETSELTNIRYLQKPCSPKDVNGALQALLEPAPQSPRHTPERLWPEASR